MKNLKTHEQKPARAIRRVAGAAALAMAVTIALPGAAQAQGITPPPVPGKIAVPDDSTAFLLGHGVGTQNYACQPSASIGKVAWTLFTPEATLFGDRDEQLTTHFFGPNPDEPTTGPFGPGIIRVAWQDSRDTSTVWGRVLESSLDANFVAPGAIPWLLVEAVGKSDGPTGGNTLSLTTFIQRLNTTGGVAPSEGCSLPTDIGRKAFVPYTADYFFFKK